MKKMKQETIRKSFRRDERAVSAVIGVILMIAITVVIAAVVAAFAYGIIGGVATAPDSALVFENADVGKKKITMIHHGGDTITDAFDADSDDFDEYWVNASVFENIQIRINGSVVDCWASMNGTTVSAANLKSGDELELGLGWELKSDDTIAVVHIPSKEMLQRVVVS